MTYSVRASAVIYVAHYRLVPQKKATSSQTESALSAQSKRKLKLVVAGLFENQFIMNYALGHHSQQVITTFEYQMKLTVT